MREAARSARPTLFLDRDGTLIVERHYLSDPAGVELEKGVVPALAHFAAQGFRLVVVTNQSGIARGKFNEADLAAVNARVDALLAAEGIQIEGWYHCPHGPDEGCRCRKPAPGMLDAADADWPVDWAASAIVGDKPADVEAGRARGIRGFLVATGHGMAAKAWAQRADIPFVSELSEVARAMLDPWPDD